MPKNSRSSSKQNPLSHHEDNDRTHLGVSVDANESEVEVGPDADGGGFTSTSEDTDDGTADAKVVAATMGRRRKYVLAIIVCVAVAGLAILGVGAFVGTSFLTGTSSSSSEVGSSPPPPAPMPTGPAAPVASPMTPPVAPPVEDVVPATSIPSQVAVTEVPVMQPTLPPSMAPLDPTSPPSFSGPTSTVFCVVADVPYFQEEADALPGQLQTQMNECQFVFHLGDIMAGEQACTENRYTEIKELMANSVVPVFFVVGDNEWNDCGDFDEIDTAWGFWEKHLMNYHETHPRWQSAGISITRQQSHMENFYFIKNRTLFFALNIVGGWVHNRSEWITRLSDEVKWIKEIVTEKIPSEAAGVIILGHSRPTDNHAVFFEGVADFIQTDLRNGVPFMYLHGDGHSFIYSAAFYGQQNWIRIQHEGGVRDPVLRILTNPNDNILARNAYIYDRQLHLER